MVLVRELSFRFCYTVLFGNDHCRRNLSACLKIIDGFFLSVEIATNCDSDKLPILSRCLLVIELKSSNCYNILFIPSFWHGGFQVDLAVKFSLGLVDLVQ